MKIVENTAVRQIMHDMCDRRSACRAGLNALGHVTLVVVKSMGSVLRPEERVYIVGKICERRGIGFELK